MRAFDRNIVELIAFNGRYRYVVFQNTYRNRDPKYDPSKPEDNDTNPFQGPLVENDGLFVLKRRQDDLPQRLPRTIGHERRHH